MLDGLTDTKPATDLSKIAAAYKAKFDELKAKYPQARILYALQCMFRSAATEAKPVMTGLPAGTIMTNNFTALQSSERILFTEETLGVPVIDATDEVWALGSGLTISDMIHPTAEGAVKLGRSSAGTSNRPSNSNVLRASHGTGRHGRNNLGRTITLN